MNIHTNSFSTGINRDISVNKYPNTSYYWAENFRLISKEELSIGALTNIKGTIPKLLFPTDSLIMGSCLIRDVLIVFARKDSTASIYKWDYEKSNSEAYPTLIYESTELDFTHPIKAIGRYETENIQKIYFTDGLTFFKHLNIIPTSEESYPLSNFRDADSLDLVSDVNFSQMSLEVISGGNLKTGKIQYAYQLYSKRGSESVFSPASKIIHLTKYSEQQATDSYFGSEAGELINKSVNITISDIDSLFNRVRVVALDYTVLYQQPSIRIVGEYDVSNVSEITVTDHGGSIGELTLSEFRALQNDLYPKTLDIKDDILFIGNIKSNIFDVSDFDARAFRSDYYDNVTVYNGSTKIYIQHINGEFETVPPETDECFNSFNDLSKDFTGNIGVSGSSEKLLCKYKPGSQGTILGGKGVNVEYEFITEQVILDNYSQGSAYFGYPTMRIGASFPVENHANPNTPVGYQRDEIYRFGIVFFDTKGRQSFTKWIGDIRFPSNREMPFIEYSGGTVYANILGIRFHIDTSSIDDQISGYQIVRAERTSSDKTIISQGLVSVPIYTNIGANANRTHLWSCGYQQTVSDIVKKYTSTNRSTQSYSYEGIEFSTIAGYETNNNEVDLNDKWIEFDSPEIAINKTDLPISDSYIDIFGSLGDVDNFGVFGYKGLQDIGDTNQREMIVADKPRSFSFGSTSRNHKGNVVNSRTFSPRRLENRTSPDTYATKSIIDDNKPYNNVGYVPLAGTQSNITKMGLRGTHGLLTLSDNLDLPLNHVSSSELQYPIANYKVNRGKSIYGGSSYEARTNNSYYPASEFVNKDFDSTFIDPGESPTVGYIQIINKKTGFLVEQDDIIRVTTDKYFEFYVNNYGNEDITVSMFPFMGAGFVITNNPSGTIAPGTSALGRVDYTDTESGMWFTNIIINGDADNVSSISFTVGVNFVTGNNDIGGLVEPSDPIGTEIELPDDTGLRVFGGDTYISYFPYARTMYDLDGGPGTRFEYYIYYPVESTMNLELRLDKFQSFMNWGLYQDENVPDYRIVESLTMGVELYGNTYPLELGNLYRYNSVYSAIDKSKEYRHEPFDYDYVTVNDVRIAASEKKINGEYIDSWTKFKFSNFIDVDSKHDAITKIVTFKNNLFYIQPTAIGIVSVNDRSLIQDNNSLQLSLGTGGVLGRYDYISDKSGSSAYNSIVTSDNFLYYIDSKRKRINRIVPGQEVALSVVKGLDAFLDSLDFNTLISGFDRGFNEVLFAIDDKTIVFNEMADAFISQYSFTPSQMITIGNDLYSIGGLTSTTETPLLYGDLPENQIGYAGEDSEDPDWGYILIGTGSEFSSDCIYKHNVGNYGTFYDNSAVDSIITLIINPQGNNICVFDNLDLRTDATTSGVDDVDDTFYKLIANNSYQDLERNLAFTMGSVDTNKGYTYNEGTIKRIGRIWRTPIISVNGDGSYNRMIDSYLKLTLKYQNSGNKFKVGDIATYFRPSKH